MSILCVVTPGYAQRLDKPEKGIHSSLFDRIISDKEKSLEVASLHKSTSLKYWPRQTL